MMEPAGAELTRRTAARCPRSHAGQQRDLDRGALLQPRQGTLLGLAPLLVVDTDRLTQLIAAARSQLIEADR